MFYGNPRINNGDGIYNGGGGGGGGIFSGSKFEIFAAGQTPNGAFVEPDKITVENKNETGMSIVPYFQSLMDDVQSLEISLHVAPFKFGSNGLLHLITKEQDTDDIVAIRCYGYGTQMMLYVRGNPVGVEKILTFGNDTILKILINRENNIYRFRAYYNGEGMANVTEPESNFIGKNIGISFGGQNALGNKFGNKSIVYSENTYIKLNGAIAWGVEAD